MLRSKKFATPQQQHTTATTMRCKHGEQSKKLALGQPKQANSVRTAENIPTATTTITTAGAIATSAATTEV